MRPQKPIKQIDWRRRALTLSINCASFALRAGRKQEISGDASRLAIGLFAAARGNVVATVAALRIRCFVVRPAAGGFLARLVVRNPTE